MAKYIPTEYEECLPLVELMEILRLKFSHIHHEMFTRSWKQKNKAKALVVRPGVPDCIIIVGEKLVFIEMKRIVGSKVSDAQRDWLAAINTCTSVEAHICRGYKEAEQLINNLRSNE